MPAQSAAFAAFNDPDPCPVAPDGTPRPDPEAHWEQCVRERWLKPRPRPPSVPARKERDPVFTQRLVSLEQLLRLGPESSAERVLGGERSTEPAAAAETATGKLGRVKEPSVDETIDGGMPIRQKAGDELKRASEGILLAFKQGRPLKDALPLSLVTSLLYRSWELDGTIPSDYKPVPPPVPLLSHTNSYATTPPISATSTPPPPIDPPNLAQMGGTAEDGRLKVDMLRGSRWRTEKEIASGSDVI